jgi:hypothetical protein
MSMAVTDEQVATLQAQLAGDVDEHRRLLERLDPVAARTGYTALITAAFFQAVDRRFVRNGRTVDDSEIIQFVGSLRARSKEAGESIDPVAAERLIKHSLGHGSITDLDGKTVLATRMLMLAGLVADEQFNAASLDSFLAEAREVAEELKSS